MTAAVFIHHLQFAIRGKRILDIDELSIEEKQVNILIGPNGCGKTTLLSCICGLKTFEGRIELFQRSHKDYKRRDLAKTVAWVPSSMQLSFDMKVKEILLAARYPWHQGYPSRDDQSQSMESLELVGARELSDRYFSELSSGEQQKVQIARALSCNAKLLVFDESCAHLDLKARHDMMGILKQITGEGNTVILSSHDQYVIPRFADHTIAMKNGAVLWSQTGRASADAIDKLFDLENVF